MVEILISTILDIVLFCAILTGCLSLVITLGHSMSNRKKIDSAEVLVAVTFILIGVIGAMWLNGIPNIVCDVCGATP